MANENRRVGCGCLPLIALFFIGSVVLAAVGDAAGDSLPGGLLIGGLAVFVLLAIFASALRRRRQSEARDVADDGSSGASASPPRPVSHTPAPPPPHRSTREVRSGTRSLSTEPEDPDSQAFKQRLADAVADLADNVEGMPGPGERSRLLTSEEMIARAKKRIAEFRDPD